MEKQLPHGVKIESFKGTEHEYRSKPLSEWSDTEYVREYLRTHNSAYFSYLYRKYAGKVYGKCLSILKNEDEARDAVQDIFMKIMTNMVNFGERSQFSTWVYSITYNFCIDNIRRRKKEKMLFTDDIERAPDVADDEIPDEYLLEMDVKYLKQVLEQLPSGDKMILLMKYQDEMTIRDIAEVIDKTESAVKMKIKRAKHKAQELYEKLQKKGDATVDRFSIGQQNTSSPINKKATQ